MARWIDLPICHVDDLVDGQALGVDPFDDGQDLFFVVRFRGGLHAWLNSCPHMPGSPMSWKRNAYMNAAGTLVTCHAHGALFEPDTGLCVQGACVGHRLSPMPVVVDEAGQARLVDAATLPRQEKGSETWQQ